MAFVKREVKKDEEATFPQVLPHFKQYITGLNNLEGLFITMLLQLPFRSNISESSGIINPDIHRQRFLSKR